MSITATQLARSVGQEASQELSEALQRIEHCLDQLDEDQVRWRPDERMNSIANLVLHLAGNIRQWILAGIGGTADVRDRPAEFSTHIRGTKQALLEQLQQAVEEAKAALCQVTPAGLLRERCIQGFEVSGTQAIFESVAHFRGHTQEIVHMTRSQLGDAYQFAFVPQTPAQGAPQERSS